MGRQLKNISYYFQLKQDDCMRTAIGCVLHIHPSKLPHPVKECEEYFKNGGKMHWLRYFNKFYKPYGFRVYKTKDCKGFSIGITASKTCRCHSIICLYGRPYHNPDSGIFRSQYQSHQVHYFVKIKKLKEFNKIWNKK